jgi:hypothetical protein
VIQSCVLEAMIQPGEVVMANDNGPVGKVEFEAALLRQEHRPVRIVINFLNRHKFDRDDDRYQAVTEAIVWRFSVALLPTFGAGGAGVLAIIGLLIASQANGLVNEQNRLIQLQHQAEPKRHSVFELVRLSRIWYGQLHALAQYDKDMAGGEAEVVESPGEAPPEAPELIDTQEYETDPFWSYEHNRDVVPEYKLHVLILMKYVECNAVVMEAEKILVMLTDYDKDNPGRQLRCTPMMPPRTWHDAVLPTLDGHIQKLTLAAAEVLGPTGDNEEQL